eukprot:TRINITY_DN41424_c0_g1_i1.p1 TRINITY_DN41424_c0_g1~~TRINITY_DN41424_c0_g1_i1.p1  ORF type:complete len:106 (+),score=25.20 TRINITY_DN41424_c0_g1_i1:87-404(+)
MCIRDRHIELSRTTCMKRIDENEANKQRMMSKSAAAKQQVKRAPSSSARVASKQPSMFSVNAVPLSHKIGRQKDLSLIHISEPTRLLSISYAVFCLKKKKQKNKK